MKNIVIIKDTGMGTTKEVELKESLMQAFLYSLCSLDQKPSHILLYTDGVRLTTKQGQCLEHLKELAEEGVKILTCGACLKYFKIEDKLLVGETTNMYEIVSLMSEAERILKP